MFPSAVLLFAASALFSTSNAADFVVQVGQGGLKFAPDHVSGAVVGDTVTFQFLPGSHTATQSTLGTPCVRFAGGFDSGLRAGAATPDAANTFQVTVNSTDPIWVYCATGSHCTAGMVFAVNAASDAQLTQFQQKAITPGGGSASSATTGGTSSTSRTAGAATSTSSTCTGGGGGGGYGSSGPSCSAGFSTAQVGAAALMTVLAGSFATLLM